jgi:hypothetical protein
LVETAAKYFEAFQRASDAGTFSADESNKDAGEEPAEEEADNPTDEEAGGEARTIADRYWDLILSQGFNLKTTADGWKLFFKRMNVPPLAAWTCYAGFDRLQRALTLAEKAAFYPDGMVRWLNDIRSADARQVTVEDLVSAEDLADGLEEMFRDHVSCWAVNPSTLHLIVRQPGEARRRQPGVLQFGGEELDGVGEAGGGQDLLVDALQHCLGRQVFGEALAQYTKEIHQLDLLFTIRGGGHALDLTPAARQRPSQARANFLDSFLAPTEYGMTLIRSGDPGKTISLGEALHVQFLLLPIFSGDRHALVPARTMPFAPASPFLSASC